jgi:hypothetical protein
MKKPRNGASWYGYCREAAPTLRLSRAYRRNAVLSRSPGRRRQAKAYRRPTPPGWWTTKACRGRNSDYGLPFKPYAGSILWIARGQFGFQAMQRQMRHLTEPLHDERAVRLENALAVSAHLARRNRAGRPKALRPLHHRRHRHAKPRRHARGLAPAATAATTRSRMSSERGLAIRCWPPPQPAS